MNKRLLHTAIRNISRNKRRSLLSGIAIGVAAMSIVLMFSLIAGMSADMEFNLKKYYTGEIQIKNIDFEEYERFNPIHLTVDYKEVSEVLDNNPDVVFWSARNTFPASLYIDGTNFGAVGVGVDFKKEAEQINFEEIVKEGRLPMEGKNETLIGAVLARDLQLTLGDKITLISTTASRGTNAITLEIVGLAGFPVASLNSTNLWVPLDRSQYFLRMGDDVSSFVVMVQDDAATKDVADALKAEILKKTGTDMDVRSWRDLTTTYGFFVMAQQMYNFMAFIFFLLGSTVIINTTMMVIFERMREIGTLGALGMHGKELVRMFFLEGAIISAAGAFIGVLIGVAGTVALGKVGIDFTDVMSGMDFEVSSILYPKLNGWTVIIVYVYAVAVSSLSTLIPSRKAAKIEPVDALRYI